MLRIRLSMGGVRKRPVYKIVVADGRYPRDGKFIEKVGSYNPLLPKDKKERVKVEFERIKYWMSKGAQPTLRVSRILGEMQLMPMPKPGNNPLKAIPKKDRKAEALKSVIYLHNKYPSITKIHLGKKSGVPEIKLKHIKKR